MGSEGSFEDWQKRTARFVHGISHHEDDVCRFSASKPALTMKIKQKRILHKGLLFVVDGRSYGIIKALREIESETEHPREKGAVHGLEPTAASESGAPVDKRARL